MPDDTMHVSPFEQIRQLDDQGNEFWSARDLADVLGYVQWRNFRTTVEKAQIACESSGHAVSDHFADTSKMVVLGSGSQRKVEDVRLSRYACYLVVMNGDPSKEIVALGQTYFAVKTREAEIADQLVGLTEVQRRLHLRSEMRLRNTELAAAASGAGVVTERDFALFQDHGYRGLYAGETARMIAARKGVKPGTILDHMGSEELAANWFRATQAEAKIRREEIDNKADANRAHHDMGAAVRRFIIEQGGTMPEDLPTPAQSIQELQREEQRRLEREHQLSLFELSDPDPNDAGEP
jgi:DNA-damage-inducible protein D